MCTFGRKNLTSAKLVIIYDGLEIVQCLLTDADADTVALRVFYFFFVLSSRSAWPCIDNDTVESNSITLACAIFHIFFNALEFHHCV